MESDIHFTSKLLNFWQPFTQGERVFNDKWEDATPDIVKKALKHLKKIDTFCSSNSTLSKEQYTVVVTLTNTIAHVVDCIRASKLAGKEACANPSLTQKENSIAEMLSQTIPEDLKIYSFMTALIKMPAETSAIDALIGRKGIFTSHLLQSMLGIHSEEVLWRCVANSGLRKVQDLIDLFEKAEKEDGFNPFLILAMHLNESRQKARAQMTAEEREQFDKQWNTPYHPLSLIDNKIMKSSIFPDPVKIEAHDFIRENRSNSKYQDTVFKGEKGDYFYKSHGYGLYKVKGPYTPMHAQSPCDYFWSPDGKSLYLLKCIGENSHYFMGITNARYSLEFDLEGMRKTISFAANQTYAIAYLNDQPRSEIPFARYERLDQDSTQAFKKDVHFVLFDFETSFESKDLFKVDEEYFCVYADHDFRRMQLFRNKKGQVEQLECVVTKRGHTMEYTFDEGKLSIFSDGNKKSVRYKKGGSDSVNIKGLQLSLEDAPNNGFVPHPARPQETVLKLYQV
ncbi:MAG: hypothetical protein CK425_06245 [Parachlamydia sp.]|nr:MAG: hypothetical protein CK425_06245 [Parachlamydia sp.]